MERLSFDPTARAISQLLDSSKGVVNEPSPTDCASCNAPLSTADAGQRQVPEKQRSNSIFDRRAFLQRSATAAGVAGLMMASSQEALGAPAVPARLNEVAARSARTGMFDVRELGASGNGITDDTNPIQYAINCAQRVGGIVFFPPGAYAVRSLFISERVALRGCGWEGQSGATYASTPRYVTKTAAQQWRGSILLAHREFSTFLVATSQAVEISDLQITYPALGLEGTAAITVRGAGPESINTGSMIDRVCITGADTGIRFLNALDFRVTRCELTGIQLCGIQSDNPNYPSWGDNSISQSLIWMAGTARAIAGIMANNTGGLNIFGVKVNGGGINTSSIAYVRSVAGNSQPMLMNGVSCEGAGNVGLLLMIANSVRDAYASTITVSGCQFWSGQGGIRVVENDSKQPWALGLVVTGNHIMTNGDSAGKFGCDFGCVDGGALTGNVIGSHGNTGSGIGVLLRSSTRNVSVLGNVVHRQGDGRSTGFIPTVNEGVGNRI